MCWTGTIEYLYPTRLVKVSVKVEYTPRSGSGASAEVAGRRHDSKATSCSGRGYLDTELPYAATSAPC
jgi:hypothetical protein